MANLTSDEPVELWVVYFDPKDFPGKYVVRRWEVDYTVPEGCVPTADHSVHDDLTDARGAVPRGSFNIGRMMEDDPIILEAWV